MTSHRLAQPSHLHPSASSAYSYPSKPHVLAGLQDAYWSDEEVVSTVSSSRRGDVRLTEMTVTSQSP